MAAAGAGLVRSAGGLSGLARVGALDQRLHTSNAASYLNGTGYQGADQYVDEPVVLDKGLITAGGMAPAAGQD